MAKAQTFADKTRKKALAVTCPVCQEAKHYVRHVKAVKGENGAWKFRTLSVGVCKCNSAEVYG